MIIINALHSGGAEKTTVEIVRHFLMHGEVTVVSLSGGGPTERELRAMGANVELLGALGLWSAARALARLAKLLRACKPDYVLTFLYLSNVVGSLTAKIFAPRAKVYWNVRNNVLDRTQTGLGSYYAAKVCAWASRSVPHEVVYCSSVARLQHEAAGYHPARSSVVENSPAAVPFVFSLEARDAFRRGRFEREFLFLYVGRFDRIKRVDLYIEACARVYRSLGNGVRFLIAGRDMEASNGELATMIAASGCSDRFALLGFITDREALYSGADCLVLTSETEGSPNVIFEAMATRLPAIILDTVGTEHIVGEGVRRLPSRDMALLVSAMEREAAARTVEAGGRVDAKAVMEPHPLVSYYSKALLWH